MSETLTFLDYLEAFNRKERFFLVANATGTMQPGKAAFRLSEDFRTRLARAAGIERIPEDAMGFMDYHLDWLHAAAVLWTRNEGWPTGAIRNDEVKVAGGTQEDIDLVVAWGNGTTSYVVLIEAKGETSWGNSQALSKATRLAGIFGTEGAQVPGVVPFFCLMSPKESAGLSTKGWPTWCTRNGRPVWLALSIPEGRQRVFRANELGNPAASGRWWAVRGTDGLSARTTRGRSDV